MSKVIQKGQGYNFNSDQIIMFTDERNAKSFTGSFDTPSMYGMYQEDPDKMHMGMQSFFLNQKMIPNSIFPELYAKKQVLEVDGFEGEFTYSHPIVRNDKQCMTVRDYSYQIKPGIDEGKFKIGLNRKYSAGDILTNDVYRGQQIYITNDDVDMDGDAFIHTVILADKDKRKSFNPKNLISGVRYERTEQRTGGEFGTNFGAVDIEGKPGEMKLRFRLGGTRGIESMYTGYADKRGFAGATQGSQNYMNDLMLESEKMGEVGLIFDKGKNGGKPKLAGVASTAEFLVLRELEKVTATSLMFAQAAEIKTANSHVVVNEGLWHQLRRGKIIKYARPGAITVSHIKEAVEYVFRSNPMKVEDRQVTFKCGKQAYDNVLEIFGDEVNRQVAQMAPFLQSSGGSLLPKPVITSKDGSNQELVLDYIRFTGVFLAGIGRVYIEHDINLDLGYNMTDRLSRGFHKDGHAETTYSMVIWDAMDQAYSNNAQVPKGASLVEGGKSDANLYLVRPKNGMTYWGRENGRYDARKSSDIISSHKQMAQSFWAYNSVALHLMDISRFVMIELSDSGRKGFY
ncbi:structural protein [Cellulophaga phage phi4:1]|uniref:Structural protein n=3 Tax=Lightbulbvirus Cba41 TaxID=1918524 RepID=A0A0S2MWH4_9CAUD|nr:virion structural protein [Cellulophaga phage phi4:1]AGO49477.1 structural protein [Cellulophaga phage phi4:1]ALO80073.1 structural protein [Cellulophaga phage phi4:1_13]ALO80270.1 structural protein [Cellulophaga phage phi4:1_18]